VAGTVAAMAILAVFAWVVLRSRLRPRPA
jgi:hypothetical protein